MFLKTNIEKSKTVLLLSAEIVFEISCALCCKPNFIYLHPELCRNIKVELIYGLIYIYMNDSGSIFLFILCLLLILASFNLCNVIYKLFRFQHNKLKITWNWILLGVEYKYNRNYEMGWWSLEEVFDFKHGVFIGKKYTFVFSVENILQDGKLASYHPLFGSFLNFNFTIFNLIICLQHVS